MKSKKKKTHTLIDREKWTLILQRFIEVLRINIFIVDHTGKVLITPCRGRYGWDLLAKSPLGFDLLSGHSSLLDKFKQRGFYLEYHYQFDLHNFAIPITIGGAPIAYLIVGPVILNKRLDSKEYSKIAKRLNMDSKDLLDGIHEIRTMSFNGIKAVLDLLDDVAQYVMELRQDGIAATDDVQATAEKKAQELSRIADNIDGTLQLDELLGAFLNIAMKCTNAECGSIMFIDRSSDELTIRAAHGIKKDIIRKTRLKMGEGIAGIAAKEDTSFVIRGNTANSDRIKDYLNRPEISHAITTPFHTRNSVCGVVNLHTKEPSRALSENSLDTIKILSRLTSVALDSIQPASL